MLHSGASVNYKNSYGANALHYATSTSRTNSGWTPLHIAAVKGDSSVIQYLISVKADVTAKTNDNKLPSDLAKSRKVKRLLCADIPEKVKPRFLSLTMEVQPPMSPVTLPTRAESSQTIEFNTAATSANFRDQLTSLMRQNAKLSSDIAGIRKELNAFKWFIPWKELSIIRGIAESDNSTVYLAEWRFTQVAVKKVPQQGQAELLILQ
jgi:ankyrin repeat protein